MAWTGHTVLAVPVPELEAWVRERTAFYDASFVSADPDFVHAHVTILGPWIAAPAAADLAAVAEIARSSAPFAFGLAEIEEFPDGLLHLRPDPAGPFGELTARLTEAFPGHPPYGGAFGDVVPHLTLDRRSAAVTPAWLRASLGEVLPATCRAARIDLQWWGNHACRRLATWPLGS
ncbi:MAG: 2'-5' RNA ligase family protein [Nocardioides sp.]|uniref:2'-5' RNA ligase family protein n=1 Tax=Nocardioides sp. TaxID=35761 RepID=UPI0039E48757